MADHTIYAGESSRRMRLEIGRAIRAIRISLAMKQEDLAAQAGIGLRTVRRMEAGGSLSLESFLRIAAVLHLEEEVLNVFRKTRMDREDYVAPQNAGQERTRPSGRGWSGHPWTMGNDMID